MLMSVTLPRPPSINNLYGSTYSKGRIIKFVGKIGKAWFETAGWELKRQLKYGRNQMAVTDSTDDVLVYITLYTCRKQDLDNIGKVILDLLVKQQVIHDDSQVVELHMYKEKVKTVKEERVVVGLEKWEDQYPRKPDGVG